MENSCPCGLLEIRAQVYAWDISVRGCHFDQTHGFFNGTHCFFAVDGQEWNPVSVEFYPPEGKLYQDWTLATAMSPLKVLHHGFGSYLAQNYDELIDHPIEMGKHEVLAFKAAGVPHQIVLTGKYDF